MRSRDLKLQDYKVSGCCRSSNGWQVKPQKAQGFTLIEVLIATAIFFITSTAINLALFRHSDSAGRLEEKLIANWVASNSIAEARLAVQYEEAPTTSGTVQMAGREWRFQMEETTTSDADLKKLEVKVFYADDKNPTSTMDGYFLGFGG